MEISLNAIIFLSLVILAIIGALIILLIYRNEQIKQFKTSIVKMRKSFEELDQQAKLIVRTDLELNKAQEELDKRLNALDALQKTSHLISTTLDQKEILDRVDATVIQDLGFEKSILFLLNEQQKPSAEVVVGYGEEQVAAITNDVLADANIVQSLTNNQTYSSIKTEQPQLDYLRNIFFVEHFVIVPISTKNGLIGFIFVGNDINALPVTEGDEELISILSNQIGQAFENAKLFEEVFMSSKNLENKIQDRTKQLKDVLSEVQKVSKAKSEFISSVSHELRTPLTSIKGYASLLSSGTLGEIPETVKERLEKINHHTDSLVNLINDLLDISRIESGRVEMNFAKSSLSNIIENVYDLLAPQFRSKNINWRTDLTDPSTELSLDRSQVERVFINLIGNALKFTPENGTVSVKTKADHNSVKVEVSDTGIGISQKDIEKLFEEFYRVENEINLNVKGTGLGLPLAKKIIEAHGGNIWVTSEPNIGTTFHFTLPIQHEVKTP